MTPGAPIGLLLSLTYARTPSVTPPVVVTPPLVTNDGAGRAAWRDHYAPEYRRREKELEVANKALLELRAKVAQQEIERKAELERAQVSDWIKGLQAAEIFALNAAEHDRLARQLEAQIAFLQEALREMDDEESIILLLN